METILLIMVRNPVDQHIATIGHFNNCNFHNNPMINIFEKLNQCYGLYKISFMYVEIIPTY